MAHCQRHNLRGRKLPIEMKLKEKNLLSTMTMTAEVIKLKNKSKSSTQSMTHLSKALLLGVSTNLIIFSSGKLYYEIKQY